MTDQNKNEMVFQDNCLFLLVAEMNRLAQEGQYYSVLLKYLFSALIEQSIISSLSPIHNSVIEGTVNLSNLGLSIEGFWDLPTKSGTKLEVQDLNPLSVWLDTRGHATQQLLWLKQ